MLAKIQAVDSKARRKGLEALDPVRSELVRAGTEIDGAGRVTRNGYAQFRPAWPGARTGEWLDTVQAEVSGWKGKIRSIVWVGASSLIDDKPAYEACGLLAKGPRHYVLDSAEQGRWAAVLQAIERRTRRQAAEALKSTLVVIAADEEAAPRTLILVEMLAKEFEKHGVEAAANFVAMAPPSSSLARNCTARGIRVAELALDNDSAACWGNGAPLTRASLLALAGVDLPAWAAGARLDEAQIHTAWSLSAFLYQQAAAGRGMVTLLMPESLRGASAWTKQAFEASLGQAGVRLVNGEPGRLADYPAAKDPRASRSFLLVERKGEPAVERQKLALLKRAGYPVAVVQLAADAPLSAWMQFVHYAVFGLAWLRGENFAVRPAAGLCSAIAESIYQNSLFQGGVERTPDWQRFRDSIRVVKWRAGVTFHYDRMPCGVEAGGRDAASAYASILKQFADAGVVGGGELVFFGDMRYAAAGRKIRKALERGAAKLFRERLKLPCDVAERPAVNETTLGSGRCFTTLVLPWKLGSGAGADSVRAQFLAVQAALEKRVRLVVVLTVKDASEASAKALEEFFRAAAASL